MERVGMVGSDQSLPKGQGVALGNLEQCTILAKSHVLKCCFLHTFQKLLAKKIQAPTTNTMTDLRTIRSI